MRKNLILCWIWIGLGLAVATPQANANWLGDYSVPRGCNRPVTDIERMDATRVILLGSFSVCGNAAVRRLAGYNFSSGQFYAVGGGLDPNPDDRPLISPTAAEADGSGQVYLASRDGFGGLLLARVGADNLLQWIVSTGGLNLLSSPVDMDFGPDGALYIATAHSVIRGTPGSPWSFSRLGSADLFPGAGLLRAIAYDQERSQVVVGGTFQTIAGTAASNLAFWNGSSWQPLSTIVDGNGVDGSVHTLESVLNGNGGLASGLYIAGDFTAGVAGFLDLFSITRYNGSGYNSLGAALSARGLRGGPVLSIRVNAARNRLLAAGSFHTAGASQVVNGVVQWDGGNWLALDDIATGLGLDPGPAAVVEVNGRIVVGGNIDRSGTGMFNHMAHYQAGGWRALGNDDGSGLVGNSFLGVRSGSPGALLAGDAVFIGEISRIGLQDTGNALGWDASTGAPEPVIPLAAEIPDFTIGCADPADRVVHLYKDGASPFGDAGISGPHAQLNTTSGLLSAGSPHPAHRCVVSAATGVVYSARNDVGAGTVQIRSFNPQTGVSTSIGSVTGQVFAMGFDDMRQTLYIGGALSNVAGVGAANAARYDVSSASWDSLGGASAGFGLNNTVTTIGVDALRSDYVYFGGRFTTAGGIAQPALARWDSLAEQWVAMADFCAAIDGSCPSLLVEINRLLPTSTEQVLVGGDFSTVDGGRGLVAFDGTNWSDRFDGGVFDSRGEGGEVTQLHLVEDQLIVTGFFSGTGRAENSVAASGLAVYQLNTGPVLDPIFADGFD